MLFAQSGSWTNVESRVDFGDGHYIRIGDRSGIGRDSVIAGPITIGEGVMVGPELLALMSTHHFQDDTGHRWDRGEAGVAPVEIGDGAWIGARVTLLPNVKIGRWSVIGAGAVVTRDIPDYAVAVGVPARVVRFWNEDASQSAAEHPCPDPESAA